MGIHATISPTLTLLTRPSLNICVFRPLFWLQKVSCRITWQHNRNQANSLTHRHKWLNSFNWFLKCLFSLRYVISDNIGDVQVKTRYLFNPHLSPQGYRKTQLNQCRHELRELIYSMGRNLSCLEGWIKWLTYYNSPDKPGSLNVQPLEIMFP